MMSNIVEANFASGKFGVPVTFGQTLTGADTFTPGMVCNCPVYIAGGLFAVPDEPHQVIDKNGNFFCASVIDFLGNQLLTQQQGPVEDATGAGDVVGQLNALLAALRTHGLIAT